MYNKKFNYSNVSLGRAERKRQPVLFKFIDLNSLAVATNCDSQKVVRMRNRDSLKKLKNLIIKNLGGKTEDKMKRKYEISEELKSIIYIIIAMLILLVVPRNDSIIY